MGNCFSDPSSSTKHKQPSGGQKLGSAPNIPPAGPASSAQKLGSTSGKRNNDPPRTLGGGAAGTGGSDAEARERALLAAEERAMNVSGLISSSTCITSRSMDHSLCGSICPSATLTLLGKEKGREQRKPESGQVVRQTRGGSQSPVEPETDR
jgi:hypothetical protein